MIDYLIITSKVCVDILLVSLRNITLIRDCRWNRYLPPSDGCKVSHLGERKTFSIAQMGENKQSWLQDCSMTPWTAPLVPLQHMESHQNTKLALVYSIFI